MSGELNPQYTFETLVVGAANRLAVTAARAVARNPGGTYNPLFIYSASGLGKTHLLHAIGREALEQAPGAGVEYVTLEELVDSFRAALAQGEGETFRRRFRDVNVLLVDDVQFLADRKEMQSELLRLVEAVQSSTHQIVLTSDRSPDEIANLDERLISRFAGGLVIDIGSPDYETRVAILRRKMDARGVTFEEGVLEIAARRDAANVRELLGRLNRLIALQAVHDGPFTPDDAARTLGVSATRPTVEIAQTDEFSQFLSDISATVAQTVEAWRQRVGQAILRWEGEGYRTRALEQLLENDTPPDVDAAIRDFELSVARLRQLQAEVEVLDPDAAGDAVFRDPDLIADAQEVLTRVREGVQPPPGPAPGYALAEFALGPSNQVAVNAVRAVVREPGVKYNPLVLVGPSGVGKSHLLHGVGNALTEDPGAVVACLSAQAFTEELIAAIDSDRVERWRSRYRRASAFLLDDVHLVAGKERTQDELFHLFNVLTAGDHQLVFSAPVLPEALEGIEPRLVSRLAGGLVVEVGAPDPDVRLGVVRRLLTQHGIDDAGLAAYLAGRRSDSVRSVQGELNRLLSAADGAGVQPDVAMARHLLEGLAERGSRRLSGPRTSGIVGSSASGVRSREKMIWDWPDVRDRISEDY
jgi:chromosomal replication initiation ATPase DnaA